MSAYVFGAVIALSVGYFIAGIPIQLTDSLENIMGAQRPMMVLLRGELGAATSGYVRPLLSAQIRLAVLLSHGHYFATFKAIQIAQLIACALLLVRLVRPIDWPRAIASALGVAVLFGAHTFTGTITEAFPINTYLTIVVCTLMAANLAVSEPAWWKDAAIVALFAFAVFTVETGALVLVVVVAARIAGARGVSRAGLAGVVLVATAYLLVRVLAGHLAGPPMAARSEAGFGFGILSREQLVARFGAHPSVFYAYNVVCQLLTVLFAEPREGAFRFLGAVLHGGLRPTQTISVLSSTGLTVALVWFIVSRWREWTRWPLDRDCQLVVVFLFALAANAAVSYPYVKDVIVSAAGALFAVAGAVALAHAVASLEHRPVLPALAIALCLTALTAGWSVRVIGAEWNLRRTAFFVRNEWLDVDLWFARNNLAKTPQRLGLVEVLQRDAIERRVPPPLFYNARAEQYLMP